MEVRDAMMPVPEFENDKMSRSQKQEKLPPELKFPDNDRLRLGHEARVGGVIMETWPRIAVVIAELTAHRTSWEN